ncbi:hypothetical protein [Oceanibaculum nanhaiense]|uniref:hypothetical protein n=1 Tax=Oceanibaculum nanhaiense TaxID=1909734 RepID=UPI003D2784C2
MQIDIKAHLWLTRIVIALAVAAMLWSCSMLVAGFTVSGQLDSAANPLGRAAAYLAALAVTGATAVFYYVLGHALRVRRWMLQLCFSIVLLLTLFASLTQGFMVVDAALGESFVKETEAKIAATWRQAVRIDTELTGFYGSQIEHYRVRMREENPTGQGPRYRAAEDAFNSLRATYGSTLGRALPPPERGVSLTVDLAAVGDAVPALRAKAEVMSRFTAQLGVQAPNVERLIQALDASLAEISASGWLDRRTLVYRQVVAKTSEMIASVGLADLGFTLNMLLAFIPDLIQVLCTCLLVFLGRRPAESLPSPSPTPEADWTPADTAWGEQVGSTAH